MNTNLLSIQEILEFKNQVILQGPPGTGKTYTAKDLAYSFVFKKAISNDLEQKKKDLKELEKSEQYQLIQFHPSYTYEDFVRGIVAKSDEGEISYQVENKVFADFAKRAASNFVDSKRNPDELSKEKWLKSKIEAYFNHLDQIYSIEKPYLNGERAYVKRVNLEEQSINLYHDAYDPSGTGFRFGIDGILRILKEVDGVEDIDGYYSRNGSRRYLVPFIKDFRTFLNGETYVSYPNNSVDLKNYLLIIDEINRANLPSVLGELIYALEYRGESVESMYDFEGDRKIIIPPNLYIIGTMNTADRSVGHIDYAIHRRFAFVDILPSSEIIDKVITDPTLREKSKKLFADVSNLFTEKTDEKEEKTKFLASDFKAHEVQLGHSYFLAETTEQLILKLEYEIKPILNEYIKDGILSEDAREIIKKLKLKDA